MFLVARLKNGHGSERTGAHRHVRKLIRRTVSVDSEEMRAGRVDTSEDKVGTDVSLVSVLSARRPPQEGGF